MTVTIIAYGCRHGAHPPGLSRAYDCREISNPHHDRRLRALTGFDDPVRDEVMRYAPARSLVRRITREVLELVGQDDEIKIGIYCTGGRHRSVVVAMEVVKILLLEGLAVQVVLRDRGKWKA